MATEGGRPPGRGVAGDGRIGEIVFNVITGESAEAPGSCFLDEVESSGARYHPDSSAEQLSLKLSESNSNPVEVSGIS